LQSSAASPAGSTRVPLPQPRALDQAPFGAAGSVLILVAFAIWIASAVWCVAAWGAFRNAFGASRPRAWAATLLWLALLAVLIGLGLRLG
jgi:Fe2+ transport system protein B